MSGATLVVLIFVGIALIGTAAEIWDAVDRRKQRLEAKKNAPPELTEKQKRYRSELADWDSEFSAPLNSLTLPEPTRIAYTVPQHDYDEETTTVVSPGAQRSVFRWCTECGGQKEHPAHADWRKRELKERHA